MNEMKKLLTIMLEYHRWAYEQLFISLQKVPDGWYFDRGVKLFFGSIHGTLNHLCLVDRLWYGRFINKLFLVKSLDQELYQNRGELQKAILRGADQWMDYVKNASFKELNESKTYKNTKGLKNQFLPATTLLHVVNHGTHHRGQITAALTALGFDFEPLDIFYSPVYQSIPSLE
jgi:uncharacterized damage-inducible protein DinB